MSEICFIESACTVFFGLTITARPSKATTCATGRMPLSTQLLNSASFIKRDIFAMSQALFIRLFTPLPLPDSLMVILTFGCPSL